MNVGTGFSYVPATGHDARDAVGAADAVRLEDALHAHRVTDEHRPLDPGVVEDLDDVGGDAVDRHFVARDVAGARLRVVGRPDWPWPRVSKNNVG